MLKVGAGDGQACRVLMIGRCGVPEAHKEGRKGSPHRSALLPSSPALVELDGHQVTCGEEGKEVGEDKRQLAT